MPSIDSAEPIRSSELVPPRDARGSGSEQSIPRSIAPAITYDVPIMFSAVRERVVRRRSARRARPPSRPRRRLVVVPAEHAHVGLVAVRGRELGARRQRLEHGDRVAARLLGLGVLARAEVRHREAREVCSLRRAGRRAAGRARSPRAAPRSTRCSGRSPAPPVRTPRAASARSGAVEAAAVPERARVLCGRLAVRAAAGRVLARRRARTAAPPPSSPASSAWWASRADRAPRRLSSAAGSRVERAPPPRRHRALDREPRQLVPERRPRRASARSIPGARCTRRDASSVVGRDGLDQPELGPRGNERRDVEQPPRRRLERRGPREHRVAHRRGQRVAAGRQHLGHVEGVAAGQLVQRLGVGPARLGERAHRLGESRGTESRSTPGADASSPSTRASGWPSTSSSR